MSDDQQYKTIDGKEVPVLKAKTVETIKHKQTGKIYASKAEFDADVADTNTDTTAYDFQQDLSITVAKLSLVSQTKK